MPPKLDEFGFLSQYDSTDAGQERAGRKIYDAGTADSGAGHDPSGMIGDDAADQRSILTQRMGLHGGQDSFRIRFGHYGHQLAFIGHIEGIESQHLAGRVNGRLDGNSVFSRRLPAHP